MQVRNSKKCDGCAMEIKSVSNVLSFYSNELFTTFVLLEVNPPIITHCLQSYLQPCSAVHGYESAGRAFIA